MHLSSFVSILALPGALAFPWHTFPNKRADTTGPTLYAYGTNISGYPVYYGAGDGGLYISATNETLSGLQSVTWDVPALSAASKSTLTAISTNGTSVGAMHLTTDSGVAAVSISATGTTGLTAFGQQLVYISGSAFQSKFWAKQVEYDGEAAYMVTWNEENALEDGIIPLTLKTLGPAAVVT